ncbi:hypothetical protein K9B32_18060 [Rhizobium sp. 3T7]|uniref:hypothetical protein n=1 Tax=Rhizobium sp. 3T7 TaxID=2874922 RepID=UPI001CD020F0|nr:hypothetical protein [Rhizobium sp. 3T7]MBZ9792008.1 hypothetical protein [Rhizobium sp. 3T7]
MLRFAVMDACLRLQRGNPVGLDHILVGRGVKNSQGAKHLSIGDLGSSIAGPNPDGSDQQLAISDHCPIVAQISY